MFQQSLLSDQQVNFTSDDWYTPPWIFDKLNINFSIDVASPPGGVPWIPSSSHFSLADDGLAQPWQGEVWMNPPFSNPLPWIVRFIEHRSGVALVPTSNGKWQDLLWQADVNWVTLPSIRFHSPTKGVAKGTLPTRCWLVAFGRQEELARFGRVR